MIAICIGVVSAARLETVASFPPSFTVKSAAVRSVTIPPFASTAAMLTDRVVAAASFHGVRLCTDNPESPHRYANSIKAELYIGCAQTDSYAPTAMIEALDKHLRTTPVRYRIETYPETHHGFVFPKREGMYQKAGAERHWERLIALFRRNLG